MCLASFFNFQLPLLQRSLKFGSASCSKRTELANFFPPLRPPRITCSGNEKLKGKKSNNRNGITTKLRIIYCGVRFTQSISMLRSLPTLSFLFSRTKSLHYLAKSQRLISWGRTIRREEAGGTETSYAFLFFFLFVFPITEFC